MTDVADESIKISGWQVKLFATLLGAAILGGVANYLSFRDWRVQTDATLDQIRSATSLPRSEYEIERRYLSADLEQLRARLTILEQRQDRP